MEFFSRNIDILYENIFVRIFSKPTLHIKKQQPLKIVVQVGEIYCNALGIYFAYAYWFYKVYDMYSLMV